MISSNSSLIAAYISEINYVVLLTPIELLRSDEILIRHTVSYSILSFKTLALKLLSLLRNLDTVFK